MFDSFYNHTLYEDDSLKVAQVTSCPFPLEELQPCWPTPQLPPPLHPEAELMEAVRSSDGDVVMVNEWRAFNGQWHLVHCQPIDKGPFANVVLFPPYAEKLAATKAFIDNLNKS